MTFFSKYESGIVFILICKLKSVRFLYFREYSQYDSRRLRSDPIREAFGMDAILEMGLSVFIRVAGGTK